METDRGSTIIKQSHLLDTKTVWLEKEALNVRFAELGNPTNQTVLLLHGVPENLQCWSCGAMALPYGDGLTAPPSNEDIARVAVGTLMNPERGI